MRAIESCKKYFPSLDWVDLGAEIFARTPYIEIRIKDELGEGFTVLISPFNIRTNNLNLENCLKLATDELRIHIKEIGNLLPPKSLDSLFSFWLSKTECLDILPFQGNIYPVFIRTYERSLGIEEFKSVGAIYINPHNWFYWVAKYDNVYCSNAIKPFPQLIDCGESMVKYFQYRSRISKQECLAI